MAFRLESRPMLGVTARIQGTVILGIGGFLCLVLSVLATQGGLIPLLVGVGAAGFIATLAVIGPEKTGFLVLMGAFFTAPWYKGAAPSPASPVTATDLLLFLGFALLLPKILRGELRLPVIYWVGALVVLFAGLIASAVSVDPNKSYLALFFWMITLIGLPMAYSMWGPSLRVIDWLAASFVVGQGFSFALGTLKGYVAQGRYAGMASHPNYFAEGGMLALALLIYLIYRHFGKSTLWTIFIIAGVANSAVTVYLSGSRAAILVVAVLVLMIPFVERRPLTTFFLTGLAALGIAALPVIADLAGNGSAIDRLVGGGGASQSNTARSLGLDAGIDRFFANPFVGDGLVDLFDIHNNFVEVAVAIGIFGTAGYLCVLYAFARPILGTGQMRRLCYPVWAYIGFGATVPSLYDRSAWTVIGLSVVAMAEFRQIQLGRAAADDDPAPAAEVTPLPVGTRSGAAT